MSIDTLYRCTPRTAKALITDCLYAGLVPFLQSSPGIGKSSIMRQISDDLNLKMIDHRLSTSAPEDMTGLPRFGADGMAYFAPFVELFPVAGTPLPKDRNGWMIFLDEFNSAPKSVQAASYKLLLDRMTGQHHLHENVVLAAAGNLASDRAITNNLSTAMQSRLVHLELEENFQEWLEDVAIPQKYDNRIIAFLSQYPSRLMDFDPEHNEKTFCCPRTWEFMNRLLAVSGTKKEISVDKIPLYAGTITSGIAVEFVQFTKVFENLVNIRDVVNNPEEVPVPSEASIRWATVSHLIDKIDAKTMPALCTYIKRFPISFRILFLRSLVIRHPDLKEQPAWREAVVDLQKYTNS